MRQANRVGRRAIGARLFKSAFNKSQRFAAMLALFAMLWYSVLPAGAGTNYWTGTTDATWDNLTNWSLGTVAGAGDDVIFPTPIPATGGTITLGADLANSLTFQDAYTLSGGTLTLGAAGNITVAPTITANINSTLTGPGGLNVASNNGLTLLDFQAGGGTLVLSAANTYLGGTTISSGILSTNNLANGGVASGIGQSSNAAANLVLNGGSLSYTGGAVTSDRLFTLGVSGGTIESAGSGALTLSNTSSMVAAGTGNRTLNLSGAGNGSLAAIIGNPTSGTTALVKNGAGTWTLSGANAFTGGLTVNQGFIATSTIANDLNLGAAGSAITLNGGGIIQPLAGGMTLSRVVNIGVNGGTFNVVTAGSGGKILTGAANQLVGGASANITKTGAGDFQLTNANTTYSGTWNINSGFVETQNATALGSGVVTVNGGGELVVSMPNVINNSIVLNGGVLSANGTSGGTPYTGPVNVSAASTMGLRTYQTQTTASSFGISGPLSGGGNLNITAPAAATLTLSGNNTGYSGAVTINTNATVQFNTGASVLPNVTLAGGRANYYGPNLADPINVGTPGVNAIYYNFGSNPTASGNPNNYAVDQLYIQPRTFSRVDAQATLPNPLVNATTSNASYPVLPVAGFGVGGTGGVNDGIMWKGLLNITTAGSYQFTSNVDDQDILYIDGVQIGAHTGNNGQTFTALGTTTLSAGYHSILYKYSQGTGGGYSVLDYTGPDTGGTAAVIPASALTNGSFAKLNLPATVITTGTGTIDLGSDSITPSVTMASGTGLTVLSPSVSNLTVSGTTTLAGGTFTLSPTTGSVTFNGSIGQIGAAAVTMAGPYLATFNATNTYTGLTTVSGGELDLNATGGNAIPGNLTITAANGNGLIRNVKLLQPNQIADNATVTISNQGVLDVGTMNDTIGTLVMNGGTISGTTGSLNIANLGTSTFTAGNISASIAGSGGINKTGSSLLTLSGNNTYTGLTTIGSGAVLRVASNNALGAVGAINSGDETDVFSGGQLQIVGGVNIAEGISLTGTGLTGDGAVRSVGANTLSGTVTFGVPTTIQSDSGRLTFSNPVTGSLAFIQGSGDTMFAQGLLAGLIFKSGSGALLFGDNHLTFPVQPTNWSGGTVGFSGAQSFGAFTVPTPTAGVTVGRAVRFDSDPGSGVSITTNAGSDFVAGYAADNALLSRVDPSSTGNFVLGADSANALDFTSVPNLNLGALGRVFYSGTITPGANGYNFGQPAVPGFAPNVLTLTKNLTGASPVNVSGGILDLTLSSNDTATPNLLTGGINITGGKVRVINDPNLGAPGNVITLNGGTLQLTMADTANDTQEFGYLGNGVNGGRTINVGASGGTIEVTSRSIGATPGASAAAWAMIQPNSISVPLGSTLNKTGLGQLLILNPLETSFQGDLVVAPNGGTINILRSGDLRGLHSITLNTGGVLSVDTNSGVGSGRQFVFNARINPTEGDRIGDSIPILLQGGTLLFNANGASAFGVGAGNFERVGTVTAGLGQNTIQVNRNTNGGELAINNLVRNYGSGTVRLATTGNTFGSSGDNPRIVPVQINGVTPANNSFVGGWLVVNSGDFGEFVTQSAAGAAGGIANYGASATFPGYAALTSTATPGTGNFATGVVGSAAADVTLGTPGAASNFSVGAIRFAGGATRQVLFANTTGVDTLFVESGGILSDNSNNLRNIGANTNAFTRGRLTAGSATPATLNSPQELFLHNNQNTFTIFSQIIDNPVNALATVAVVKDLDGTVVLDSPGNTYSGGTNVYRGTLTSNNLGSLGQIGLANTGIATVKNSILNLNVAGAIGGTPAATNTAFYYTIDNGQINLSSGTANTTAVYNTATDRFNIAAGSTISDSVAAAGFGLNSLTRVATPTAFTGGGQVYLAPDSIVKHQMTNAPDQGTGGLTIQNLGNNADLYFAPGGGGGVLQTLTIGTGTPWKGIGADRGTVAFNQGTIFANSDFYLNGTIRDGGSGIVQLGSDGTVGGLSIVNNAGAPINAYVQGQLVLQKDFGVTMPTNLTFVVTPGAIMQPNRSGGLGVTGSTASVRVQAGGTLDPGGYVAVGAAANQDTAIYQNLPYPAVSPLNGSVTVEAGGRFILNDASGIGSAPAGSYLMKTDSILELATTTAFSGRGNQPFGGPVDTTGYITPGQFVFEAGAVIRLEADILNISQSVTAATNGERVVYELANGNRNLTNQNNPFLRPVVGTPTIAPENVRISNGGMLTDDTSDRTLNEGRGRVFLGDGAVLAGTTGTYFNTQEGMDIDAGANITIGSTRYIDGMPKLGSVNFGFTGPNSNTAGAGAKFTVIDGAQLAFGAVNVIPDTLAIDIPTAVTQFPAPGAGSVAQQPSNGSSILLTAGNFAEVMGKLTGNGAVLATVAGAGIAPGFGQTADFTFNGVIKSTNGQNPDLYKVGTGKMILTGSSDSTGHLGVFQGTLEISGTGNTKFSTANNSISIRAMKGGTLALDNTVTPLSNRLNNPQYIVPSGGMYNLIGNATTPVTEAVQNFANSVGTTGSLPNATSGYTFFNITPGAAATNVLVTNLENFNTAGVGGQKGGTWVLRSPAMANQPGTYSTAGALTINPANATSGLFEPTNPNFYSNGAFGIGTAAITGQAGTPVAPARGDYLGTTDANGLGDGFLTVDSTTAGLRLLTAAEYSPTIWSNVNTNVNEKLTGTVNISGDTRVQTLTLTPGTTLNINGTLPLNPTPSRLLVNDMGIFAQAGAASTINGVGNYLQVNGSTAMFFHTQGDLNVNATVFSDTSIDKTNAGTLNFGSGALSSLRGSVQIDAGTINFGATNNTFAHNNNSTTGFNSGSSLYVNGGTLNLNGNSEFVNQLTNSNPLFAQGGTLTSPTAATVTVQGGGQFSGSLAGAIALDKVNTNTLTLTNASTNTGATQIRAGTLELRDQGTLSNTSNVDLYYGATLTLNNGFLGNVVNRINTAAPLNVRGGTVQFTGAAGQVASQSLDTMNLLAGRLDFNNNSGGSGALVFNIGNLVRPAHTGSTMTINQNFGFVGTAGNTTDAIRYFIGNTTLNGNATTPLTLHNNIIGGWAVWNGDSFLTYNATAGVGQYGNTADGFANYESTDFSQATITQNVNDGTSRTITTSHTANSLRMAPGAAQTMFLTGNVAQTIDSGGIITNANQTIAISGFYGASLTSNSGELDVWVNQGTTQLNVPVTGNIDLVKSGGATLTLNPAIVNTMSSTTVVGTSVTVPSTTGLTVGMTVTGTGIPAADTIASITNGTTYVLTTAATAAATNTLTYGSGGAQANTYTGKTFVNNGTLNLSLTGANGSTLVSVPNDLIIQGSGVVTETVANQLKTNATITLLGNARFNAMNAAGITETIGAINFGDASGAPSANNALDLFDRTASQPTSTLVLSSPTAISGTNTNPNIVPFIGTFAGIVGFNNAGGSTINVNAPTSANGLSAIGLRIDAQIGAVPTGIVEGGLIKSGTGMFVLNPGNNTVMGATGVTTTGSNTITVPSSTGLVVGQTITGTGIPAGSFITSITGNTVTLNNNATATASNIAFTANILNSFGSPSALTDVFNVSQGIVRADQSGALGSNFANTTVQSGAGVLGAIGNNQPLLGSLTLKTGSFLGVTINSTTFGAGTLTPANQSIMKVAGDTTFYAQDYFIPATNGGTLTINSLLTGTGGINIVGPYITSANGLVQLGNPITSGAGSNDYSGTITVNTNATLRNQQVLIAPATSITGNDLGTATINLNGGTLSLRDDGSTSNTGIVNTSINYGNNVTLSATSFVDANRASTNAGTNTNTINLGTLTVPAGSPALVTPFTGNTFNTANNSYAIGFGSIDGAGTLVKGGHQVVNINGYAATFSGNFQVAGPQGLNVQPSAGLNLNAPTNNINNLTVNGIHNIGANIVNVAGTLAVGDNAGSVANGFNGITTGSTSGALSVPNTSTLTALNLVNNGIIGSTGGDTTIAATQIQGTGTFQTNGQSLTLAGPSNAPVAFNDSNTASLLKFAGNNTVNLNPASNGTVTGGVVVQSGTVRIAPSAATVNPFGVSTIKVLGYATQTVATDGTPVSVATPVLNFDGGSNAITHGGSISNNGIVRVSSGVTTVAGTISGTTSTTSFVPGLLEGRINIGFDNSANRPANNGTFGVKLEPRMGQSNVVTQNPITGWSDNELWTYSGQFFDADGKFTFAENIDDNAAVWIDGVLRLSNGTFNTVTSTAMQAGQTGTTSNQAGANAGTAVATGTAYPANPNLPAGWHTIEIRFQNGGGGAGPVVGNGFFANYGFGLNTDGTNALDGTQFVRPIDPGDGTLFRTALTSKGVIDLLAGSTLNAGGFSLTSNINLGADGAILNVTTAATSDADNLNVTGAAGTGTFNQVTGATAMIQNVNVAANTTLLLNGAGTTNIANSLQLDGNLTVDGATVNVAATGAGAGNVVVSSGVLNTLPASGGVGTGPVVISGTGTVNVQGNGLTTNSITVNNTGLLHVDGSVASSTGVTVNDTAAFEATSTQTVKTLTINGGQARIVSATLKVLTVGDNTTANPLTITGAGKLDLKSHALIVDYSAGNEAAALTSVRGMIIAGYNGGDWQGNGITSADAVASPNSRAVGYAQASDLLGISGAQTGTFLGQTVDASAILVRTTVRGDANLDGTVGFPDLVAVAQHYGISDGSATWITGDFNYDGNVDFTDLVAVAQNYDGSLPAAPIAGASVSFDQDMANINSTGVPEPGTLGVLALAGLSLLRRRRR